MEITEPRSGVANIHTLISTEVNNCFIIYHTVTKKIIDFSQCKETQSEI